MASFTYTVLAPLGAMSSPTTQSMFSSTAATASYIRAIHLHNVSSSFQAVSLYYVVSGSQTASISNRFFQTVLSASSTQILEYAPGGFMITQSGACICGSCTNNNGVNYLIFGGTE